MHTLNDESQVRNIHNLAALSKNAQLDLQSTKWHLESTSTYYVCTPFSMARRHIQKRVVEEVQALWANSSAGRFRSMMTLFLRVSTALLTILRLPLWPFQTWPALMVTTCTSSRWLGCLRSKKAKQRHGLCSVDSAVLNHFPYHSSESTCVHSWHNFLKANSMCVFLLQIKVSSPLSSL